MIFLIIRFFKTGIDQQFQQCQNKTRNGFWNVVAVTIFDFRIQLPEKFNELMMRQIMKSIYVNESQSSREDDCIFILEITITQEHKQRLDFFARGF